MLHREGLPVSLADESLLDHCGILTAREGTTAAYGLSEGSVHLFSLIALAGEKGLSQSRLPKELREDFAGHLLPLELQELVAWERDKQGRKSFLVLTWKGQEALAAARPAPAPTRRLIAGRRAALR